MAKKYYAFISYDHADMEMAKYIQHFLEYFRYPDEEIAPNLKPNDTKYLRKVFLDKTDLSGKSEQFKDEIKQKLANSRFLIVICSPNSVKKKKDAPEGFKNYVDWEIQSFLDSHGNNRDLIFPVIYDERINKNNNVRSEIKSYLPSILDEYSKEFVARNLPDSRPEDTELKKKNPNLKHKWEDAAILTTSSITKLDRDQIRDRHHTEQMRVLKQRITIASIIAVLLVFLTTWAFIEKNRADKLVHFYIYDIRNEINRYVPIETKNRIQEEVSKYMRTGGNKGKYDYSTLLINDGNLAYDKGDTEQAQILYQECIDIRRELAEKFPQNDEWQKGFAFSLNTIGNLYRENGDIVKSQNAHQESLKIMRQLANKNPQNADYQNYLMVTLMLNGNIFSQTGDIDKAQALFQESLDMASKFKKHQIISEQTSYISMRMGDFWNSQGKSSEAEKAYLICVNNLQEIIKDDPKNNELQQNLAICLEKLISLYFKLRKIKEANELFEENEQILTQLIEKDIQNNQWKSTKILLNYFKGGLSQTFNEKLNGYLEASEHWRQLLNKHPENMSYKDSLADALALIGNTYLSLQNYDEALKILSECLNIRRSLVEKNPQNFYYHQSLCIALKIVGSLYEETDLLDQSMKTYQECLHILRQLVKNISSNIEIKADLSDCLVHIGDLHIKQHNLNEAYNAYTESINIIRYLLEKEPQNIKWSQNLSSSLILLGDLFILQDNFDMAQRSYQESLNTIQKLVSTVPYNNDLKLSLIDSLLAIAGLYMKQKDTFQANETLQESLNILHNLMEENPQNEILILDCIDRLKNTFVIYKNSQIINETKKIAEEHLNITYRFVMKKKQDNVWKDKLHCSLNMITSVYESIDISDESQNIYQKIMVIRRELVKDEPQDVPLKIALVDLFNAINTNESLSEARQVLLELKENIDLPPYYENLLDSLDEVDFF